MLAALLDILNSKMLIDAIHYNYYYIHYSLTLSGNTYFTLNIKSGCFLGFSKLGVSKPVTSSLSLRTSHFGICYYKVNEKEPVAVTSLYKYLESSYHVCGYIL